MDESKLAATPITSAARRLAGSPRFQPVPGMNLIYSEDTDFTFLGSGPYPYTRAGRPAGRVEELRENGSFQTSLNSFPAWGTWSAMHPDLGDPATAGVLLAMLPSSWMIIEGPEGEGGEWTITLDACATGKSATYGVYKAPTLGEAAALALLALWGTP